MTNRNREKNGMEFSGQKSIGKAFSDGMKLK